MLVTRFTGVSGKWKVVYSLRLHLGRDPGLYADLAAGGEDPDEIAVDDLFPRGVE
mgnify:CR=1 FL=1